MINPKRFGADRELSESRSGHEQLELLRGAINHMQAKYAPEETICSVRGGKTVEDYRRAIRHDGCEGGDYRSYLLVTEILAYSEHLYDIGGTVEHFVYVANVTFYEPDLFGQARLLGKLPAGAAKEDSDAIEEEHDE